MTAVISLSCTWRASARIIACILNNEALENIADLVYYVVIGCMLAQHELQMKTFGYPLGSAPQIMR